VELVGTLLEVVLLGAFELGFVSGENGSRVLHGLARGVPGLFDLYEVVGGVLG